VKIGVAGLWHLGAVTAACLASVGHDVVGFDPDAKTVAGLNRGEPPLFEPGLAELLRSTPSFFTTDAEALRSAELVWVTYDTPVDEEDRADVDSVMTRVVSLFDVLGDGALVVVSSQLPVGSTRRLEEMYARMGRREYVTFACSPENLRLGNAIESFLHGERIVVGVRSDADREKFARAVGPVATKIEWMSVESAEMAKHALNAFLATSVAFINEIAVLCEQTGADAKEVERALKSDPRIGQRAYLSPGSAFAGGTLARDVVYLSSMAALPLISNVKTSNDAHKGWPRQKLLSILGDLSNRTVAVWGLTYKPGTDTLRRSSSVELCSWLSQAGARVLAHDPAVKCLPSNLSFVELRDTAEEAARNADAVVVATEWPEYRSLASSALGPGSVVIDVNRFVASAIADRTDIRYFTAGKGML
jgi:UDPglucose 6-dehydrogenase